LNPAPPGPTQTAAAPGRRVPDSFRTVGKWFFVLAWVVVVAGFVGYRLLLGDDSDGMGLLAAAVSVVTLGIAGPLGLVGAVLWSIGAMRARRSGHDRP